VCGWPCSALLEEGERSVKVEWRSVYRFVELREVQRE